MKQGKIFLTVILTLITLALLGMLAYTAYSNLTTTLQTTTIYEYEVGAGCTTDGYIVRTEELLYSTWPINVLTLADGEKVGAYQSVCRGYQTADARENQQRAEELTAKLEQLRYAYSEELSISQKEQLEDELADELANFAKLLNGSGSEDAAELGSRIKGQTLRLYSSEADRILLAEQIHAIQQELTSLSSQITGSSTAVTTTESGWFSSQVDGFEKILTPEALTDMTLEEFDALEADWPTGGLIGRLCTDETWYYACTIPEAYAAEATVGRTVSVSFAGVGDAIDMVIERVGQEEGGRCLLVLSTRRYLQKVAALREQSAQVIFSTYHGLRVPKSAVRYEDGSAGVFIVESTYAKWKKVEILYDAGESYVVKLDKSSTANLWPGDEVIVATGDVYNGKVVR